jgi:hypothetical protein
MAAPRSTYATPTAVIVLAVRAIQLALGTS